MLFIKHYLNYFNHVHLFIKLYIILIVLQCFFILLNFVHIHPIIFKLFINNINHYYYYYSIISISLLSFKVLILIHYSLHYFFVIILINHCTIFPFLLYVYLITFHILFMHVLFHSRNYVYLIYTSS